MRKELSRAKRCRDDGPGDISVGDEALDTLLLDVGDEYFFALQRARNMADHVSMCRVAPGV